MTRASALRIALLCLALAAPASARAAPETPAVSIGVAPFETLAPPGTETPDLATLLADRLGTRGVQRVVGPAQLGAEPLAEPDAARVVAWAGAAAVAAVAVGRTTRIGNQLSVDVRLRAGDSGDVVGTYVIEILRPDELEAAVDRLAGQLIDGTTRLAAGSQLAAVSAAGEPAPARPSRGPTPAPFGLAGAFDSDEPLSIESDELEAFQQEGRRRLLFSKNVKVVQGDVTLTSNTLEALYPENSSQPDRLVAKGQVRLVKRLEGGGSQSAHCDQAIYDRKRERLVCRGNAELREGDDRVRGREIEFDLAKESVKVRGGASVVLHPDQSEGDAKEDGA